MFVLKMAQQTLEVLSLLNTLKFKDKLIIRYK